MWNYEKIEQVKASGVVLNKVVAIWLTIEGRIKLVKAGSEGIDVGCCAWQVLPIVSGRTLFIDPMIGILHTYHHQNRTGECRTWQVQIFNQFN